MMEIYMQIRKDIFTLAIAYMIVAVAYTVLGIGIDNTDKDRFNRSGFQLLKDYGTGKEYLFKDGVIIERIKNE